MGIEMDIDNQPMLSLETDDGALSMQPSATGKQVSFSGAEPEIITVGKRKRPRTPARRKDILDRHTDSYMQQMLI